AERTAHDVTAPALEPPHEHWQRRQDPFARAVDPRRVIAVPRAEIAGGALGKSPRAVAGEALVDRLEAQAPDQTALTEDLVGDSPHHGPIVLRRRHQRIAAAEPLRESDDLGPTGPRWLVVVHRDGRVVAIRPGARVGVAWREPDGEVVDPLHVEAALRGLRPGAGDSGGDDQAQAPSAPRFFQWNKSHRRRPHEQRGCQPLGRGSPRHSGAAEVANDADRELRVAGATYASRGAARPALQPWWSLVVSGRSERGRGRAGRRARRR